VNERRLIGSGTRWEDEIGYSRAVVQGPWCFVSGTTDGSASGIAAQADGALSTIEAALTKAGFSVSDVVRVRYLVSEAQEFEQCWPVLKRWFGSVRPAATMEQVGLIDPALRIEIEVTALRDTSTSALVGGQL
jgi:enamine deaminase RidA (YjgF/YER057c/UK114 family)